MDMIYISGQKFLSADLRKSTNTIRLAGDGIRKNYLKIARELANIEINEWFVEDDFENVIEYAEKVFSIKKSTAYTLIEIGKNWINKEGTRTVLTKEGVDFTISQLGVMLPAGVDTCKKLIKKGDISPTMSVRAIKKVINNFPSDVVDSEGEEVDSNGEDEAPVNLGIEKQIIFTEDGSIKYCGEFPVWFCDQIGELYTKLLSGE